MRCFFDIHIFNDRNENVLWLPLKTQMNGNREISRNAFSDSLKMTVKEVHSVFLQLKNG